MYSMTGTPPPTGSRVGMGVVVGSKVGRGVGGIGVGAGVAGAQAVRITLRHRPRIEIHRRFCMGISPFLKEYTPPAKRKFLRYFSKLLTFE